MSFAMVDLSKHRFVRVVCSLGLVFSLLFSTASSALAAGGTQGNLTGTVINHDTNKPVADVEVFADAGSGSFKATTDGSGHFTFLGLPSDTYVLTFTHAGFVNNTVQGVTVLGDQTVNVGTIAIVAQLKNIGTVTSRAQNSAFQPNQTTDTTTISGARIYQALGSATSTNEQNLVLAAPGAVLDTSGNISVRGSLNVELGYQFDGVNFSVPFFDANGSNGYLNNLTGGSGGSLQVVSGSGDATQGNIGAGVINIIPPHGSYPATGLVGFTVGSPYYNHQFDFSYSMASPNGRFSNFVGVDSARNAPQYAPYGVDAASIGQFNGNSFTNHDDVLDNFIYRFGKHNNQSLQLLYRTSNDTTYGNYGGLPNIGAGQSLFYPFNSLSYSNWTGSFPGPTAADQLAQYDSLVHFFPGVPTTPIAPTSPEIAAYTPLHFTKLGYSWNINPTTFLTAHASNFWQFAGTNNFTGGSADPATVEVGGQRVTYGLDLTHQFGTNHTVTLATKYEDAFPRWHQEDAGFEFLATEFTSSYPSAPGSPAINDFFLPLNPAQPSASFGGPAGNICVGSYDTTGPTPVPVADPTGCYIHDQLVKMGKWTGSLPRMPTGGIDYHHSMFQEWGVGLRDQWQVNPKLKLDYGVRIDGANYKFGPNPYNLDIGNPSDVTPNLIGNDFLRPRVFQPRLAAAYQLSPNDAVRASYGRSVNFFFAQTAGTPLDIQNVDPLYNLIPAKESVLGGGPSCGSGYHGPGSNANGTYVFNPNIPTAGNGYFFPCTNYAQSLFWLTDQNLDAPDLGGQGPPTFSNYDLAYTHQFTRGRMRGWGVKLTGFARRGFNVEENTLLANGPPNPVTGQVSASVFATRANGVEKTSGLEFMLTTPDRPFGWSGFLTMNYLSAFSSSPPVAGGLNYATDQLPIVFAYLFQSQTQFRSGFLPPFQGRLGFEYKTKTGFRINPIVAFNTGYPFGVGKKTYAFVNGQFQWIPETNLGVAAPIGGVTGPGNAYNSSYYVDPAYPGSYLKPNIAASRGYNEPDLPGNALTKPSASLDLDLEYEMHKTTFGLSIANVFNNHYGIPYQNSAWQPVATGVGGPQTGLFAGAYPDPTVNPLYAQGARDLFLLNQRWSPYNVPYNPGTTFQIYMQRKL